MPSAQKVFFPFLRERFPHLLRRYEERFLKSPYLRGPYTDELRQRVRKIRDRYGLASAPLARQARIQGVVRFNLIIAQDGHVSNIALVNGHPLLVPAAQEAVKQWVYRPTLLNGDPVEVATVVDINFMLPREN